MTNSTFSGNTATWAGGSLFNNGATLNFTNNIMANSTLFPGTTGAECAYNGGPVGVNTNNLIKDGSCGATIVADPRLGALGNYGGNTQTFPLLENSPAIDAGNNAICAVAPVNALDQRGQARDDWQCDIGAFELKLADSASITKTISGAGAYTFGPTMGKVMVNDTGGCLTGITIQRYDAGHPNATVPLQTGHWWESTSIGCASGFNVDLTLPTDFTPDDKDKVCRWTPGGQWDCAMSSFATSGILSITRNNITGFSQWTVGSDAGPTAVRLNRLAVQGEHSLWGALPFGGLVVLVSVSVPTRRKKSPRKTQIIARNDAHCFQGL